MKVNILIASTLRTFLPTTLIPLIEEIKIRLNGQKKHLTDILMRMRERTNVAVVFRSMARVEKILEVRQRRDLKVTMERGLPLV